VENALKYFGQSKKQMHPLLANPAKAVKLNVHSQFSLPRAVPKSLLAVIMAVVQDAPADHVHPVIRIKFPTNGHI
jgi:hypothetical protein